MIQTVPCRRARATRSASSGSAVLIPAASPYVVSLPRAIASAVVEKRSTVRIGPNVSSWTMRIDRSQWSKIVGRKK
ncbi:MAG TPA: hypothetical protein VFR88_07700 [Microlunatus sp.]|nr:hypothetical protein [Microlunatus sp.]